MDQDRNGWGAREYADALNNAETLNELVALAREVNARWATADDPGPASLGNGGSAGPMPVLEAPNA